MTPMPPQPFAPLVSVVLPAHNAAQTILRALNSAAAQSWRPLEIIVIDDASSDGTEQVVRGWQGMPVIFERLAQNRGAAAARNRGMALANGEYIAFLDSDDEWLPEKTSLQMALLAADPALVFVTCEAADVGPDGAVRGPLNVGRARASGSEAWKTLLHHVYIALPSVIVRRDRALALGGFDVRLPIAEDQDFWIRLALSGPVAHLPRQLLRVHDRPGSLSKREGRNAIALTLPMIEKYLTANAGRLTSEEARQIRGARYAALGRNAYVGGAAGEGAGLILKAMRLGDAPLGNLFYLVFSSAPARWLKRLIRG
jgi:glycosyltransferase involved in cell wall biosynthesis